MSAYFFLKILLRKRKTVYTAQRVKKTAQAMMALVRDWAAKPSRNSSGAIMTMAGKLERMYRLEVGVLSPGSTSFIRINDIRNYILPVVILSVVGAVITYVYLRKATKECFKGFEHEMFP